MEHCRQHDERAIKGEIVQGRGVPHWQAGKSQVAPDADFFRDRLALVRASLEQQTECSVAGLVIEQEPLPRHVPHMLVCQHITRRFLMVYDTLRVATTASRGELGFKLLLAGHL